MTARFVDRAMTPEETQLAFYDRIWSQIQIELSLINQRLIWWFTLQGFFFTAFAFSLSAEGTALKETSHHNDNGAAIVATRPIELEDNDRGASSQFLKRLQTARGTLAWISVFSSAFTTLGVFAARSAVRDLSNQWNLKKNQFSQQLPVPLTGRRVKRNWAGLASAVVLPFVSAIAWCWLIGGLLLPIVAISLYAAVLIAAVLMWREATGE
jgi:hypothetical protein